MTARCNVMFEAGAAMGGCYIGTMRVVGRGLFQRDLEIKEASECMQGICDCASLLTTSSSKRILIGNNGCMTVRQRRRWRSPWWWCTRV